MTSYSSAAYCSDTARGREAASIVIGVDGRAAVGVEEAAWLSRKVLEALRAGGTDPILVLVDSDSQRMSKRDELLGLSEFLAHLAKCLIYADAQGHPTVGLLYGHTAAGAFIATALATRTLLALPGAEPAVMDLPSMARVTKLPIEVLKDKAKSTPVFAPGLDNMAQSGGVSQVLDPRASLAAQLEAALTGHGRRCGGSRVGHPRSAGEGTSGSPEGRRHCDTRP